MMKTKNSISRQGNLLHGRRPGGGNSFAHTYRPGFPKK